MRTEELKEYMLNDFYIRKYYGGVVARDELPAIISKPSVYIVNTDTSDKPGKHWFALFYNDNEINEHFNSSGNDPSEYVSMHLFQHGDKFITNTKRLQSFASSSCGEFALFFAYWRCRNYSFRKILQMFSTDLEQNDFLVQSFYKLTS